MIDAAARFRNEALASAYAAAEIQLQSLPEAQRQQALDRIAARFAALDEHVNLSIDQMRLEAARIITANRATGPAAGPMLPRPNTLGATDAHATRMRPVALTPGVQVALAAGNTTAGRRLPALGVEEGGRLPRPSSPEAAGLPPTLIDSELAVVRHGTDPHNFYCEHVFYLAQLEASRPQSSVVTNVHGERLVGFLHVPSDMHTESRDRGYTQAERHAGTRQVVGAAMRGYARQIAAEVDTGPMRILLTGFGTWESTLNNPTGDFVSHPENIDASMREAFGERLLTPTGDRTAVSHDDSRTVLQYEVRDDAGRRRVVEVHCLRLAVEDAALDPDRPGSLQSSIRAVEPHAIISVGVRVTDGNEFLAERHADNCGLRLDGRSPMHDWQAPASHSHDDNYSLARALISG